MKQKLFKIIPFVSIAFAVIAIALLFIPKSFCGFQGAYNSDYWFSGLEVFFRSNSYFNNNPSLGLGGSVSAAGIITLVLLVLSIVGNVFANKNSALKMLAAILTILSAVMLLAMQLWMIILYPTKTPVVLWGPYIGGVLTLASGGITLWASIEMLIEEKNAIVNNTKTYSYLKK